MAFLPPIRFVSGLSPDGSSSASKSFSVTVYIKMKTLRQKLLITGFHRFSKILLEGRLQVFSFDNTLPEF